MASGKQGRAIGLIGAVAAAEPPAQIAFGSDHPAILARKASPARNHSPQVAAV